MNFIPYDLNSGEWTNHFTSTSKRKNQDGLFVIKNKKQIGEGSLRIVTPTEAVVKRARQSLKKYNRKKKAVKKKTTRKGSGKKSNTIVKRKKKQTNNKRKKKKARK